MTYDWETEITKDLLAEINEMLPIGMVLAGIAISNTETAEGALIADDTGFTEILDSDVWQDIRGDADRHYRDSLEKWQGSD